MRKLKIVCKAKRCNLWWTEGGWPFYYCKDCPYCILVFEEEKYSEQ